MDKLTVLPDKKIAAAGEIGSYFLSLNINSFQAACRHVHDLPYGYNSNRDDLMILFKEKMGSCTTKHAVIASLAAELDLAVMKTIGIYAMTEEIVAGTDAILNHFGLPYLPMVHCFLAHETHRVDLTEGNRNGKNCAIDDFLYTVVVEPNISAKREYLLYRKALEEHLLILDELQGFKLRQILQAREQGLALLKRNLLI
jgi:hypothetical protein